MRRRMTSGSAPGPRAPRRVRIPVRAPVRTSVRRRRLGALTLVMAVVAAPGAVPATAGAAAAKAGAADRPRIKVTGNETQPVFSRADAIFQTVHVETTVDSDGDGVRDQVEMRILRPKET